MIELAKLWPTGFGPCRGSGFVLPAFVDEERLRHQWALCYRHDDHFARLLSRFMVWRWCNRSVAFSHQSKSIIEGCSDLLVPMVLH